MRRGSSMPYAVMSSPTNADYRIMEKLGYALERSEYPVVSRSGFRSRAEGQEYITDNGRLQTVNHVNHTSLSKGHYLLMTLVEYGGPSTGRMLPRPGTHDVISRVGVFE